MPGCYFLQYWEGSSLGKTQFSALRWHLPSSGSDGRPNPFCGAPPPSVSALSETVRLVSGKIVA